MSEDNTPVLLENSIPNENTENNIPEKYRNRTLINKKYIFEKKIGSGSFGSVHRGKNVISGEAVAIKYEATTANITTLLWESKILNHLSGTPGVVKLRYYGTESNKNIIVMDLFSHTLCEEVAKLKELYSNDNKLSSLKQELKCINYIKELIGDHFTTIKSFDGCKADIAIKKFEEFEDLWLGIQVKTTIKKTEREQYYFRLNNSKYENCLLLC